MKYIILLAGLFVFSTIAEAQVPQNSLVGSYELVSATIPLPKEEREILGIDTLFLPAFPNFVTLTYQGTTCNFSGVGSLKFTSNTVFLFKLEAITECGGVQDILPIDDSGGKYIQTEKTLTLVPNPALPVGTGRTELYTYTIRKETDGIYLDLVQAMYVGQPGSMTFRRVN